MPFQTVELGIQVTSAAMTTLRPAFVDQISYLIEVALLDNRSVWLAVPHVEPPTNAFEKGRIEWLGILSR